MNQKQDIQGCIEFSKMQQKKAEQIQQIYIKCMENLNDSNFTELISQLDSYCCWWVRKKLHKTGCYTQENENEVMQNARIGVWNSLSKMTEIHEAFAYYAFTIYKYKTYDQIRSNIEITSNEQGSSEKENEGEESVRTDNANPMEERRMYELIFQKYCFAFMNYKTFLPRCLALYYARVLPHMRHINHEEKTIPDTKKASAKWAITEMGTHNVLYLTDCSEKYLQMDVAQELKWSDEHRSQLNDSVMVNGKEIKLKDLIYTEAYDKGQVEDWADYMHKKAAKVSMNLVLEDQELQSLVKEYISKGDGLYRFVEGGSSR